MKTLGSLLVAVALLTPLYARAADTPAEAKARQYFRAASAHFQAAQYADAQAEFAAGYELSHKPGFLFNMAECARLLNNTARALELYRQYVDAMPAGAPEREQAAERIKELEAAARANDATARARPAAPAPGWTTTPGANAGAGSNGAQGPNGASAPNAAQSPNGASAPNAAQGPNGVSSTGDPSGAAATSGDPAPSATFSAPPPPSERSAPITARWWFWTGAAAVVVGGVVTAALLVNKGSSAGAQAPAAGTYSVSWR